MRCEAVFHDSKSCLLDEMRRKKQRWMCPDCSDRKFPLYTVWVALSEADKDSSVLEFASESHKLNCFSMHDSVRLFIICFKIIENSVFF